MFQKIFFILILVTGQQSLFAIKWPQLEKNQNQECPDSIAEMIFYMAELVFHSSSENVSSISKTQLDESLKLLLEAKDSESNLNVCDENFETIDGNKTKNGIDWHQEKIESFRFAIYWQRNTVNGFRFVLCKDKVGWRGNLYSLFSIPESLSQNEFITQRKTHSISPIMPESWLPPLIIQHLPSQKIFAIDVGNTFEVLADWKVYLADNAKVPCCVVRFRPTTNTFWDLLPKEVSQLAKILDQTLGDGRDEGTMQPTGHLRVNVTRTWLNTALRPWAVNHADNTRKEVDLGLSEWSHKSKEFLILYQKINEQYPKAEQALGEYYQATFQLTLEKAKRLASYVLDLAFRNNFIFPRKKSKGENVAAVSPWTE